MDNYLINKWLKDVKKLSLKFPSTEISEKTGYSRSNISDYLNGKRSPSRIFLQKFYDVFYKDENFQVIDNLTVMEPSTMYGNNLTKIIESKDETIAALKETIETLKARIAELEDKLNGLDTKSGKAGSRRHSA